MRSFIIGFAFGIWLLQMQPALPSRALLLATIAGALCALLAASALARALTATDARAASRRSALLIALALAGIASGFPYAAFLAERRIADALPAQLEGIDIRITGIVTGLPAINHGDRSIRFAFDVERVETPDAIVPKRVSLAWYTTWRGARAKPDTPDEPLPEIHAGERWTLNVRLRRPHGNANPHGFDLEAWMLENGLRASGYVRTDETNRRIDLFAWRPADAVDVLREGIRERIRRTLDSQPYAGVIVALTIGDQRAIPQDQWQLYNRTGVSHLLSISGS